jgi:Carboxylesterase family
MRRIAFMLRALLKSLAPAVFRRSRVRRWERVQPVVSGGAVSIEGEEDCLYLNVWTEKPMTPHRSVMVFIHGGIRSNCFFCSGHWAASSIR